MKYFKAFELVDRKTYEEKGEEALLLFNPELLLVLDDLVDFFSDLKGEHVPVTVNNWHTGGSNEWRGLRTMAKAAELKSPKSEHRYEPDVHLGNAADCTIGYYSAEEARGIIIAHQDHPLLARIMRLEDKVTWVHLDLMKVANRIHLFTA
jgi:hypothetical protein